MKDVKILDVEFEKKELIRGIVCGAFIIFLTYIFISISIGVVRVLV
ncbi:MAG: hypothetical protein ACRDD7_13895 [Peptostreptococcaceae bacterium]